MGRGGAEREPLATLTANDDPWPAITDLAALVLRESPAGTSFVVSIGEDHYDVSREGLVTRRRLPGVFMLSVCGGDRPPLFLIVAHHQGEDIEHFGGSLELPSLDGVHRDGLHILSVTFSEMLLSRPAVVQAATGLFARAATVIDLATSSPGWYARADATVADALAEAGAFRVGTEVELTLELAGVDPLSCARACARLEREGIRLVSLAELAASGRDIGALIADIIDGVWTDIPLAGRFFPPGRAEIERWIEEPLSRRTSVAALDASGAVIGLSVLDVVPPDPDALARNLPEGAYGLCCLTAVRAPWRSRGIGRGLKAASYMRAMDEGIVEIEAATAADSAVDRIARSFGARETGRIDLLELRA